MSAAERYVLDSFALLAYLEEETGAAEVQAITACDKTAEGWLSIVNFGEVVYITEREQGLQAAQRAIAIVDQLPLRVAEADRSRTFAAAHVKARGTLSCAADAFAVALAQEIGGRVVTGDPEFARAEDLVSVHWLGR